MRTSAKQVPSVHAVGMKPLYRGCAAGVLYLRMLGPLDTYT